jgi:hypothetical protein
MQWCCSCQLTRWKEEMLHSSSSSSSSGWVWMGSRTVPTGFGCLS